LQPKAQVRILAVLGRQDTEYESGSNEQGQKIDISFDSQQLKNTRGRGGYIKVLEQPSAEVLKTALREVKGWHILFFAGHSNSLPDRSIGSIELNANQKPLSIDELKADLSVAINNGLQLAIFNSCDGLGLAAQLAKLNLPQSIVMRERVPDEVAKAFLQQFLDAFSYNHSLFESVRRAREHLRKEFDRKEQLPGASWLPTIVRNPAVPLPYWNDFIADSPLSWPWLMLMVLAVLTVSGSLFLSLFFEFQGFQVESVPKYIHYAQLYPHIVLYPCLFLWGGYFTLYKAWCQIRSRPKLWRQMSIAFAIALVFLGIELSSNRMMLFEIRTGAESVVSPPVSELSSISQIPVEILDVSELIDSNAGTLTVRKADLEIALERYRIFSSNGNTLSDAEKNGYHTFMFRGLSYKTWHGTGGFSTSRIFYALAFMSIIIIVLMSGVFWAEINSKYVYNSMKFLRYIVATQLIILLWLPLRIYQNRVIKDMIFGENIPVSGLDVLAYPAILTLLCISIYRSWRFESSFFAGVLSLLTVLGFIIIGVFNSNMVDITFGLQSDPATWVMWPVMFLIIIYVLYRDIFAKYSTR
ncbi:MAG: CHAT domain-containing protein, partial [Cyanobacteria bacterium P01_C01_bin.120]